MWVLIGSLLAFSYDAPTCSAYRIPSQISIALEPRMNLPIASWTGSRSYSGTGWSIQSGSSTLTIIVLHVGAVVDDPSMSNGDVLWLDPDTWDVIGTIVTTLAFLAAGWAAWVAYRQLKQNEAARLDQSRPYVLVTADNDPNSAFIMDLVVENVGAGPARDVEIKIDPPLRRVREDDDYRLSDTPLLSQPVPVLPPGYKIRTFFDSMIERHEADVPRTHSVTLKYHDGHGHEWTESSVLDFGLLEGLMYTESFNTHHVAKALRDIHKVLKDSKTIKGDPLFTVIEKRGAYMDRMAEQREAFERRAEEWERQREEQRKAQEKSEVE